MIQVSQSNDSWLGFLILVAFVMIFFVIPYIIGLQLRPWFAKRWRDREREKLKVRIGMQAMYNDLAAEAYDEYLREEEDDEERRRREWERRRRQEEE